MHVHWVVVSFRGDISLSNCCLLCIALHSMLSTQQQSHAFVRLAPLHVIHPSLPCHPHSLSTTSDLSASEHPQESHSRPQYAYQCEACSFALLQAN